MYLMFGKALIVRSSNSILLFKQDPTDDNAFREYHRIENMRGDIFFMVGNIRF